MMRLSLIVFAVLLFFWSCQPGLIYTKKNTDQVDSVLFYQTNAPEDPFLDSLSTKQQATVQVDTILTPLPKPPTADTIRTAQGFRVQIFAGMDSSNAARLGLQASRIVPDSIYVFRQNGLFKTQVGDYLYRTSADSTRHLLFKNGLTRAWIVPRSIFLYPSLSDSGMAAPRQVPSSEAVEKTYKYTIQVLVVSDESRAQSRVKQLIEQFPYPVFYKKSGNVLKIFIGKFQTREAADQALKNVRSNDYPDAWLVY